ncbi:putative carbohydrate esterase [Forsythia ovata]|uniref:Carbohydrate esterase n=1 Tax=Forsythia ovata TaxID=205694 RepID=A0ABD1QM34_9LAMI
MRNTTASTRPLWWLAPCVAILLLVTHSAAHGEDIVKDVADGVKYGYSKLYNFTGQFVHGIRKLGQEPQTDEVSAKKKIFILAGQSNMAGRGAIINGVVPPDNTPDPSKIFRLNALLEWEVAHDPLHKDIDLGKPCGVGPGMSFANTVKDRLGVIGLVPCAIGGTSIIKWEKGGILYENMIKRAKAAVEVGCGGEVKALLWYQGESDTHNLTEALKYKDRLEKFINDVRIDLDIPSLPVLEVIIESSDGPFKDVVIEQQKALKMPNVVQVDSDGLELNKDKIHLNTEAEVQMGKLLAGAYLNNFA